MIDDILIQKPRLPQSTTYLSPFAAFLLSVPDSRHVRSQETGFQLLASTKDTWEAKMPTPWKLHLAGLGCPWSATGYIPKAYERDAH